MECSTEVIARILYYVPLSQAKPAMQTVSTSFRQALKTPQAHAIAGHVSFPLEDSHPFCTSRKIVRVLPFVSLGPRHKDFSWVGFLDHLQALACHYKSLRPVPPLQTVQELILDCVSSYGENNDCAQCLYDSGISLFRLFPNVKRLQLHAVPDEEGVDGQETEYEFLKDIQLMTLQRIVLYDYPDPYVPLLAQNPEWACLDMNMNSTVYGNDSPWMHPPSQPASSQPASVTGACSLCRSHKSFGRLATHHSAAAFLKLGVPFHLRMCCAPCTGAWRWSSVIRQDKYQAAVDSLSNITVIQKLVPAHHTASL